MRIANITIGEPADMNQTAIRKPNIDKHTEVDHVEHRRLQLHARLQVFQLHDAAAEDRLGEAFAGIEPWAHEGIQNVMEQMGANIELRRQLRDHDLRRELSNPILDGLRAHHLSRRRRRRLLRRGRHWHQRFGCAQ
jgi:hypothetical protein